MNQMWTGTPEQYYELYDVAAKHLKACFGDAIKIGGYGMCGLRDLIHNPQKYGANLPQEAPATEFKYEVGVFRQDFFVGFLKILLIFSKK